LPDFGAIPSDCDPLSGLVALGDWERLRLIGDGHIGLVYLARHTRTAELAAIKCTDKGADSRGRRGERLLSELAVLRSVSHPFILGLLSAFQVRAARRRSAQRADCLCAADRRCHPRA
jgi:serine/threonine protein kinase